MITQDKAAEIAGLARYDVSAMQYTPDLLEEELRDARGQHCP